MFKIAEQYYNILEKFTKEYKPSLCIVPHFDDKNEQDYVVVNVDLDNRTITFDESFLESGSFLGISGDHRAQTVYFRVNRYFEDVDLATITCAVEYINPANQLRLYPITLKDIDTLSNTKEMILAWNLGSEATREGGTLQFSLHFFRINHETKTLAYSLHTLPCKATIVEGMDAQVDDKQQAESDDYYYIQSENFMTLVDMINQKNVYWNNV